MRHATIVLLLLLAAGCNRNNSADAAKVDQPQTAPSPTAATPQAPSTAADPSARALPPECDTTGVDTSKMTPEENDRRARECERAKNARDAAATTTPPPTDSTAGDSAAPSTQPSTQSPSSTTTRP